jgi:hypothetical protein
MLGIVHMRCMSPLSRLGDPGRFVTEFRKQARMRMKNRLVSWTQVEYHQIFPANRATLYPATPVDWTEWEVPLSMTVPLPPSLSYAGIRLLRGDLPTWAIFYTEWTVITFGRWTADAHYRGLLWRLPRRVILGVQDLGVRELLHSSPFTISAVEALLDLHYGVIS